MTRLRDPAELARVRGEIAARRDLVVRAEAQRQALNEAVQAGATIQRAVWRCSEPHRGGAIPRLAEAYRVGDEILVITKIAWLPSDVLNLRPWGREHLLGAGAPNESGLADDDRPLSRWLDNLDLWGQGVEPTGPRWLVRQDPTVILTLTTPEREPVVTAWTRCKDHPAGMRAIDRHAAWDAFR